MILVNKNQKFPVCLFLDNRGLELKLDDHLVSEQAFLDYKNIDFTQLSRWIFSRCQPRILVKNCNFPLCFRTKWALKQCLTIIQLEKKLCRPRLQSYVFYIVAIIYIFSQGLTHVLSKNWKFCLSLFLEKMGLEKMSDDHIQLKKNKPSQTKILKLCFFRLAHTGRSGFPIQYCKHAHVNVL